MGEPIYIETWEVAGNPKGNILDIEYSMSEYQSDAATDILRHYMAAAHGCTLVKLLRTREIEVEEE